MAVSQQIAGRRTFTAFANGVKGGELNKSFGS